MKLIEVRFLTLISVVLMLSVPVAAEFQVYRGNSVTLEDANTMITWARNYTFNASMMTEDGDTLSIGDRNISIGSNSTAQVNATLWRYNLTGPYHGKTAVKLGVSAVNGTNATVSFTDLPGFKFGRYELAQNNSLLREYRSGGELTWYETNWSTRNYTITYYNDTEGPGLSLSLGTNSITDGGSIDISCSSSDVSGVKASSLKLTDPDGDSYSLGCGQEFEETYSIGDYSVKYSATDKAGNSNSVSKTFSVYSSGGGGRGGSSGGGSGSFSPGISDSYSWFSADNDRFSFENIDSNVGVQSVTVYTDRNMTSFSLSVTRLTEPPTLASTPTDVYRFYEFTAKDEEAISSTEIEFNVNKSFATQYSEIVVSHYKNNGWNQLPTTQTDSSGSTWTYRTSADGFSYYAVQGQDKKTTDQEQNETGNGKKSNQNRPICVDNTCNTDESWDSCSTDCPKPQVAIEAENAITEAEQQVSNGEPGYQLLQQVRQQFQAGNYAEADRLADKATEQNRSQETLPLGLIAAGILLILLLAAGGFLAYRRWLSNQIDSEVSRIHREVTNRVRDVENSEEIIQKIDEAEDDIEKGRLRKAKKHLDKAMQSLGLK